MPQFPPRLQTTAGAILIAALLAGALYTIRDFLPALAWAAVLAIGLWPIHLTVQRRLRCSGQLSALGLTGCHRAGFHSSHHPALDQSRGRYRTARAMGQ